MAMEHSDTNKKTKNLHLPLRTVFKRLRRVRSDLPFLSSVENSSSSQQKSSDQQNVASEVVENSFSQQKSSIQQNVASEISPPAASLPLSISKNEGMANEAAGTDFASGKFLKGLNDEDGRIRLPACPCNRPMTDMKVIDWKKVEEAIDRWQQQEKRKRRNKKLLSRRAGLSVQEI